MVRFNKSPLSIEEYENSYRFRSDLDLIERVFYGGIKCNQLRAALWPYLFGLVKHRGKFEKIKTLDGKSAYYYVEHVTNHSRWKELQKLYNSYQVQWKAILPDQEIRFSTFRERKALIERDVVRCDRLHPFYAEKPQNLDTLTSLLMTYMMYDFDIGYVQGMSDLAGPILYMYKGDLVKAFWVFVEVMKLLRRNFEFTQKTIHFQLCCLYELIKLTDPIFAQYLDAHDTSNCFFAFRAIVCQFKRELMKEGEDNYGKVLTLWDTIWCVNRRSIVQEEMKVAVSKDNSAAIQHSNGTKEERRLSEKLAKLRVVEQPLPSTTRDRSDPFYIPFDQSQSDTPRHSLTETETFVLALCLSMISHERDYILANKLDSTDIHLHFIYPKLATDLDRFIEQGIKIYSFMKNELDLKQLYSRKDDSSLRQTNGTSTASTGTVETDAETQSEPNDLLSDFLIINGMSGT